MKTNFMPEGDRPFLIWLKIMMAYLWLKYAEWNIPHTDVNELSTLITAFEQKLTLTEDPSTRTKVTVQAKNDARKDVETKTRIVLKAYVTYNPLVTNADREAMGLPVHKTTRTRVAVILSVPEAEVKLPSEGVVEISFSDSETKGKAKPKGAQGVEVCHAILDSTPKDWKQLVHSAFATRTPLRMTFDGTERGKTLYLALRWENTRGEKGPWSQIYSVIIP
jgi:hypothetical protein